MYFYVDYLRKKKKPKRRTNTKKERKEKKKKTKHHILWITHHINTLKLFIESYVCVPTLWDFVSKVETDMNS